MYPVTAHIQSISVRVPRAGACTLVCASQRSTITCRPVRRQACSTEHGFLRVGKKTAICTPRHPEPRTLNAIRRSWDAGWRISPHVARACHRPTPSVSSVTRTLATTSSYVIPRPESSTPRVPRHPLLAAVIFASSSQVSAPPCLAMLATAW